jgi:hypothetical protein
MDQALAHTERAGAASRGGTVFAPAPLWADPLSEEGILALVASVESEKQIMGHKANNKGVCHTHVRKVRTTETATDEYNLSIWSLSTPETLQSASIQEHPLGSRDILLIHRAGILRGGIYIDKTSHLSINVLDDESGSGHGSLLGRSKAHFVIGDLRLGDVLVLEMTKTTAFDESSALDREYMRYVQTLPGDLWMYGVYEFTLLQGRARPVFVRKKYFRDESGARLPNEDILLAQGETFTFRKECLYAEEPQDAFVPLFEIATAAAWDEIAGRIRSLYEAAFAGHESLRLDEAFERELASQPTLDHKIRFVIEYVQNQIVYLFDAEVMHAFIPQSAQDVMSKKSGDCKAKSLLLIRLLESLGISAEFILVNYAFDLYIAESLPSPFVFNHAIVKITRHDRVFFVDPTIPNRQGLLEYRWEPECTTYLSLNGYATLKHVSKHVPPYVHVTEETTVALKRDTGTLMQTAVLRGASADIHRQNARAQAKADLLRHKNALVRECLQHTTGSDEEFLANESYEIVADDKEKNELRVVYQADLLKPLTPSGSYRVFRYYYPFFDNGILHVAHKDARINSFMGFSSVRTLHIKSRIPFVWWNKGTKKTLRLDTSYFTFSNTKKIGLVSAHVVSTFLPKNNTEVAREDLDRLQQQIREIQDSNYGIGLVYFATLGGWVWAFWRYVFIAVWIVAVLWGAFSAGS